MKQKKIDSIFNAAKLPEQISLSLVLATLSIFRFVPFQLGLNSSLLPGRSVSSQLDYNGQLKSVKVVLWISCHLNRISWKRPFGIHGVTSSGAVRWCPCVDHPRGPRAAGSTYWPSQLLTSWWGPCKIVLDWKNAHNWFPSGTHVHMSCSTLLNLLFFFFVAIFCPGPMRAQIAVRSHRTKMGCIF